MKTKLLERIIQISREYKLGDFFRNFIAVALGIIITFAGSGWIEERKTRKEINDALQLVKAEMQTNQETLQDLIARVTLEQEGAIYLLKHKGRMEEIPQDSLNKYANLPFQWANFIFSNDAMEMFKTSGLIQKIENKELSLQILTVYTEIKQVEYSYSTFTEIKKDLQSNLDNIPNIYQWNTQETNLRDTWEFYLKYPEGIQLLQQIPQIQSTELYKNRLEHINQIISFIEKEYN